MNSSEYNRVLLPLMPAAAFEQSPRRLIRLAIHVAVVAAGWLLVPVVPHVYWPLLSIVIGLNLACIGFFAHELSHRAVIRNRFLLYPVELLAWTLVGVPATVWRRAHTYHHVMTNTVDDPKRRFLASEASVTTAAYGALFWPHRGLKYNLLCALNPATLNFRNTIAALYPGRSRPKITPAKPAYRTLDKIAILFELVLIVAVQLAISKIAGRGGYIPASLVPLTIASAVISVYLLTSHSLRPLRDDGDVLQGTTSLMLPRIVDRLHLHISHHTEHHLFPTMNSNYYPLVASLLEKHFPGMVHRLPMKAAWQQMWNLPLYAAPPLPELSVAVPESAPAVPDVRAA